MHWPNATKASDISNMLLKQTGKALLESDFASFSHCFGLPHLIETVDTKTTLITRDDLENLFNQVVQDYMERNVTELIRYCEVAEFRSPLKIEATHISHVMAGNLRVAEPCLGFSVIEHIDDRWQLTATQYAAMSETNVSRALQAIPDKIISMQPPVDARSKKEPRL